MLAMGRKGFPQKDMDEAMARLRRTYERMNAEIAKSGGPWLLGKDISLADVMAMPALVRMADLGQDMAWQDLPNVKRWFDAIHAHPAFAPTYYPGSLLTGVCTIRPRARASATPSPRKAISVSDCTISRSRLAASADNGPTKPSTRRPSKAAAASGAS